MSRFFYWGTRFHEKRKIIPIYSAVLRGLMGLKSQFRTPADFLLAGRGSEAQKGRKKGSKRGSELARQGSRQARQGFLEAHQAGFRPSNCSSELVRGHCEFVRARQRSLRVRHDLQRSSKVMSSDEINRAPAEL